MRLTLKTGSSSRSSVFIDQLMSSINAKRFNVDRSAAHLVSSI